MIRKTVLLVEDEPLITLLYQDILFDSEFRLTDPMTCSGPVLEYLTQNRPDLSIVDLYLDDGPCLEVIAKLQELMIPVLIVSAHGDAEDLAKKYGLPLLLKPFDESEFLKALNALLSQALDGVRS